MAQYPAIDALTWISSITLVIEPPFTCIRMTDTDSIVSRIQWHSNAPVFNLYLVDEGFVNVGTSTGVIGWHEYHFDFTSPIESGTQPPFVWGHDCTNTPTVWDPSRIGPGAVLAEDIYLIGGKLDLTDTGPWQYNRVSPSKAGIELDDFVAVRHNSTLGEYNARVYLAGSHPGIYPAGWASTLSGGGGMRLYNDNGDRPAAP